MADPVFYLNADPDPWLQLLPQCGSGAGDPVYLNEDLDPDFAIKNNIKFAFVHLNRISRILFMLIIFSKT